MPAHGARITGVRRDVALGNNPTIIVIQQDMDNEGEDEEDDEDDDKPEEDKNI